MTDLTSIGKSLITPAAVAGGAYAGYEGGCYIARGVSGEALQKVLPGAGAAAGAVAGYFAGEAATGLLRRDEVRVARVAGRERLLGLTVGGERIGDGNAPTLEQVGRALELMAELPAEANGNGRVIAALAERIAAAADGVSS